MMMMVTMVTMCARMETAAALTASQKKTRTGVSPMSAWKEEARGKRQEAISGDKKRNRSESFSLSG